MICCKTRYSHWGAAKLKKNISPQNNCIYSKKSYLRTLKWINFKFLGDGVHFIPTAHYFDSFLILQVLITEIHHCKHMHKCDKKERTWGKKRRLKKTILDPNLFLKLSKSFNDKWC